ncbi:hypothetical protein Acr_17g0003230 [Actinidia rufa]|uniref:Ankyrin repeat family protein n=1 Tax=Actinidia rufa TaxID=165716 RepID=A0A7J0G1U0_9ERIC|nr:hypothetical protein Acr_17g0003230 [Actinidia rufa]
MLSNYALKGLWPGVVDLYKRYPELHDAKITRTQDTALHVAVSSGKEDVVQKLVDIISETGDVAKKKTLNVQNERGNTPLHLAAALGNVEMCQLIANVDRGLITSIRNKENETPLFVAARNGKKDAFLCLHDLIIPSDAENAKTVKDYPYCRSRDGQTILHVAIEGEYFGSRDIRKIQHKREKHTWSVQIMNKLLENSRQYEYLDNGQKPLNKQLDEDMFTAGATQEQAPKDKGPEKQLSPMETLVKEVQAMRADLDKITAIEVRRDMEGWESPNTNIAPELKNETAILLAAKKRNKGNGGKNSGDIPAGDRRHRHRREEYSASCSGEQAAAHIQAVAGLDGGQREHLS